MKPIHLLLLMALVCAACAFAADDRGSTPLPPSAELEKLYGEDQADRRPSDQKPIDWSVVGPRDAKRRARVLEIYRAGELKVGKDFFHAAMMLQHGREPEDFLLCHELCVTAVFLHGTENAGWVAGAKWLAAASEDRFLQSIGRNQRFGTQYRTIDPDPTWHLGEIEDGVTDEMRKAWNAPSLAEAKKREVQMNQR